MVESIGAKPGIAAIGGTNRSGGAPRVAPAQEVPKQAQARGQKPATVLESAHVAASGAPVDADRVAKIKRAVETGKFPIFPSKIADRLIALKLEWNPNEPS